MCTDTVEGVGDECVRLGSEPLSFEATINQLQCVVTVSLFAHQRAHICLLATSEGVKTLSFKPQP